MTAKTAAGVAIAAACLMSFSALPGAKAQTASGNLGSPSYQGSTYPGSGMGPSGSDMGNYGQQPQGSASGNPGMSTYGSTSGSYAPPPAGAETGNTDVVTNGPQGSPPPDWSARRNVIESERYDRLLESNPGFRQARIRKECGPITDPQLHQQCLDSFAQYEPAGAATGYGSSTSSRHHYRSNAGR